MDPYELLVQIKGIWEKQTHEHCLTDMKPWEYQVGINAICLKMNLPVKFKHSLIHSMSTA